jgi:integrase
MAYIQERTTSDGKRRYRVQVRLKGYPIQTETFRRKTDAVDWGQRTETAIREGRHFKTSEAKKHSFADLAARYEETVAPTIRTGPERVRHLNWWRGQLGHYSLADLTSARIAEGRDKLLSIPTTRGGKRSPATVVRYLASLSHALSVAKREWGWLEENPALNVTKPKEPKGRTRFLSDDERTRLLNTCRASDNLYLYPVVVLALATGMRQGEILGLRWNNVDLKAGRITLHETKNGETRVVPLAGHPLAVLQDHSSVRRIDTDLVFPGKATRSRRTDPARTPIDIRSPWLKALKQADIQDFRFHDLRHSAASYFAMNGASLSEIAEILGHKTLQMVKRYAHLSEAHTAKVVASMNEKIFG